MKPTTDATRATAAALPEDNLVLAPDLDDAMIKLRRAQDLNELIFMAGEGLLSHLPDAANAITAGCDVIDDILNEVKSILEVIQKGGAA